MPDIEDMLGKIFFLLWDGSEIREMYRYMYGSPRTVNRAQIKTPANRQIVHWPIRGRWTVRQIRLCR